MGILVRDEDKVSSLYMYIVNRTNLKKKYTVEPYLKTTPELRPPQI